MGKACASWIAATWLLFDDDRSSSAGPPSFDSFERLECVLRAEKAIVLVLL